MVRTKDGQTAACLRWIFWLQLAVSVSSFVLPRRARLQGSSTGTFMPFHSPQRSDSRLFDASGYVPPVPGEPTATKKNRNLFPAVGDIVRFYDIDGGDEKGQVLVGRISFIQKNLGNEGSGWSVEIAELDDVGSGYFTDYGFQKRGSKKTFRDLSKVSPIAASFVRAEDAFKVPLSKIGVPLVRAETYDIKDYPGPFSEPINKDILQADGEIYASLKSKILRYAALTGLAGTVVTDFVKGPEDAAIYGAGVIASLFYLFFLTVKTDTLASADAKLGSNVSNLRFISPLILLIGVAFYNKSLGDANPVQGQGLFVTVTPEQFGAAILGFLTYRIPLFLTQIQEAFRNEDGELELPGSAGVAMRLAKKESTSPATTLVDENLATVLLISGPQATGRTELVKRLVNEDGTKFVSPQLVDSVQDAVKFERLQNRGELLSMDPAGRYGLTKQGILNTARSCGANSVVVIDADVDLAKKLRNVGGLRLVGVWVGLGNVKDFETRLNNLIEAGEITIPDDESRESVVRARIKEIVQEIEFGISSGIFEFTILNENEEASLKALREASAYCFTS